ncbi:hypothetical protein GCM10023187_11830 [Nibrella viscosa]|uniref:Anti-sigma factor n=1 Tax=Nibrella viscosa TaxID=1084524 RepID=A0ABP8K3J7_9BACT
MSDKNLTERIDDYLSDALSAADRRAFEQQMQTDPVLQEEVELQRALIAQLRIRGAGNLKAQMRQWETESAGEAARVRPLWPGRRIIWLAASVVAVLSLGIWIWTVQRGTPGDEMAVQSKPPTTGEPVPSAGRVIRLPVETADRNGLGYAGDEPDRDSIWVRLLSNPAYPAHYRFTDSLYLYLSAYRPEQDQLRLRYDARNNAYHLSINDSVTYNLEKGFQRIRPLMK